MSKSRKPPPVVAPVPAAPSSAQLPEPREPSLRQLPAEAELPESHEHYDEHAYDENGQPYYDQAHHPDLAYAEGEHYDENGQPYYDENGQPYLDENGQPYDPNAYAEHPDYATAPMVPDYATAPMHALHAHPPGIPMPAPPPSAAGPYRMLPAEAPFVPALPEPRPPRPIVGSAIAVYGVLLWSFVVAGQFATSWISGAPMNQGTAAFLVFVATGAAWGFALHRSRYALPSVKMGRFIWRGMGIGALAFGFFVATIVIATVIGQASRGLDFLIAFGLVALSVAAIIVGPRLTVPKAPPRTHRMKLAVVSMWLVGAILTLVAGVELATNG